MPTSGNKEKKSAMATLEHAQPHVEPKKPKPAAAALPTPAGIKKKRPSRAKPPRVATTDPLAPPTPQDVAKGATLDAPYVWWCGCPDFEFRGVHRNPPSCKHIVAVVQTLRGNQRYINREGMPSFLNENGPLGYAPEGEGATCRRWWLAPQSKPSGCWVVERTHHESDARAVAAWMGS